jgi:hypothetical protein
VPRTSALSFPVPLGARGVPLGDLLPLFRGKVYMNLRNEGACHAEGETQRSGMIGVLKQMESGRTAADVARHRTSREFHCG